MAVLQVTKAGRRAGGKTLASSDEARQRRQLAGASHLSSCPVALHYVVLICMTIVHT